jgi:hypothetical protein
MIENPNQAVASGVAAATIRARAAAFAFGAAVIREGQRGSAASEGLHTQARAIAERAALLPTPRPLGMGGGEPFDRGPQFEAEIDEVAELDEIEAAEGAFEITNAAVEEVDFIEIDFIEIII